ncbi:hypothetical protein B9Z19DRAFT_1055987 [Tuber borchii]|uniref:Uncharacterized protein n=1 Tax=Tuber borchii TaxID=42251 RepID=A0A2T6ZGC4_TUBBO|nr:hypothetical protein B9Z19DRAFT_1055987 [Tuber borchii]
MFNPHIPDLTMDTDGSWKTPIARQSRLTKRDWPEHIRAKAEKMMHSAKEMQAKGQLVIDNDPAYQNSLREKKAREKEEAAARAAGEAAEDEEENLFDLLPPTGKNKGSVGPNRKAYPVDMTDDVANPPPQNIQSSSKTAKVPKQPAIQGQSRKLVHPVHKQPNQSNGNATAPCKNTNSAPQKQQHPQPQKKKRPMGNFLKKGGAMARFKKNPLGKRDIAYPAGPEYPPGTMIIRKKKCDNAGKCVTVAQPVAVAAPAVEAKAHIEQLDDGQPQIRFGVVPQPIAPALVPGPAPAPPPVVRILKQAPAPSPIPEVIIQQAPAPVAHPVTVVKEVVKKPCGCESSSCPCGYATGPVATCPCGNPNCGKGDLGPGGCTCGAPGCNCNERARGARGSSTSETGNGGGGHPHRRKAPSTPAELEAFWREQVPEAFRND